MVIKVKLFVVAFVLLTLSITTTTAYFQGQSPRSVAFSSIRATNSNSAQVGRPPAKAEAIENTKVDFAKDVQPIFKAACYSCHAGEKAQAELRLDTKAGALKGGVSGKLFVPGNSTDSLLMQRVLGHGEAPRMPPAGDDPLNAKQIATLRRWIDEGALWLDETVEAKTTQSRASSGVEKKSAITKQIDFATHIKPIFEASCYGCHAGGSPKAQLRLDSKLMALQGGISGKVILPGNSKESRLIHRVRGLGDEQRMPLKGKPLTADQIALIQTWIDQGAAWTEDSAAPVATLEKHWAYVKPVRPTLPNVKNKSWAHNPIDNFVLAKLEKEGLKPAPEASRETLIRRLSLDLTGLPPSVKEVDEFVADRSPGAYEKVVDRLLASPHYGERWARPWLDLARYADTNGYEKDLRRQAWKYRDWVIDALNKNMPFDQFTIEQIAGDMLPNATIEQRIASGFHRNTMLNQEGGVDQQEALYEVLVDRVNTTSTVWLGSTMACAQCHTHKYDPFPQKDYYRLYAFFNNTGYNLEGNANISEQKLAEPKLELPTPEQALKRREIEEETAHLSKQMRHSTPELEAAQAEWETAVRTASEVWTTLEPVKLTSTGGATFTKLADKSVLVGGENALRDEYIIEARTSLKGMTGIRLEAFPDASLPRGGPGRDPYGNFAISDFTVEVAPDGGGKMLPLTFKDTVADDSFGVLGAKYGAKFEFKGWTVNVTRENTRLQRQAVFVLDQPINLEGDEATLKIKLLHASAYGKQGIGRFRLSVTKAADPSVIASIPVRLRPILDAPVAHRTEEQKKEIGEHFRALVSPQLKPIRDRLAELRKASDELGIVSALVLRERASEERPSAFVRIRGSFMSQGEKVFAGTPTALHPLPESQTPNRISLARWLVDKENPLVARVTLNRSWEQIFGRGIVETSEDFGTQGERPTHPELLDWLAVEFMERGWSMKTMHRLIVTSATYRQSSKATRELLERDPYNRLLARGARFRMEAEMIRDTALAVSNQLSRKIGGASVFPYQPDGIWDIPYNSDKWTMSEGEDQYRRGLYTFVRRTSPYPSMTTFDAPSREVCSVRRVRTNTPLQALTTLNDRAFFDAARSLAKRVIDEAPSATRERAVYGFRLCVARQPKPEEVNSVVSAYEQELEVFKRDATAAKKVAGANASPTKVAAGDAELAAWTMIANTLLNLDETITKQ